MLTTPLPQPQTFPGPAPAHEPIFRVRRVRSTHELRAQAAAWDALWEASAVSLPVLQAEPLALWCETFLHARALDLWWVEVDGRPVAGLPLVCRRVKNLFPVRALPTNEHILAAEPLVIGSGGASMAALAHLLKAILNASDRPAFLWLEQAPYHLPAWSALRRAAEQVGLYASIRHHHLVGRVILSGTWEDYLAGLSKNHRKHVRRYLRQLESRHGSVRLERLHPDNRSECDRWTRRVFEVESRSWKTQAGTAVLQHPRLLAYYQELAWLMARKGHLSLYFLYAGREPVASLYGLEAKGVSYELKMGCNDAYRPFGPGHLLTDALIQDYYGRSTIREVSYYGELAPYQQAWINAAEPVGRVVITRRGPVADLLHHSVQRVLPAAKRMIGRLMDRKRPGPGPAESSSPALLGQAVAPSHRSGTDQT